MTFLDAVMIAALYASNKEEANIMDIPTNAKVYCADGRFGKTTRIIIKPTTREVTHIVVGDEGFPDTEYLVPIARVTETNPGVVHLSSTIKQLQEMPVFTEMHFLPSNIAEFSGRAYMMWPYYPLSYNDLPIETAHIPVDELEIRRSAGVVATDGRVGRVDEFLIDPTNDQITHLVLREGHLWGKKDVTIPVSEIDHYKDNTVYLKISKADIARLPGIPVQRDWEKVKAK